MICPCCKKAFTPRTATQIVCGLQCFYKLKRGKRTENEPITVDGSITNFRGGGGGGGGGGEGKVNRASKHICRQAAEDAMTHDLKEWVMEAAGTGYLNEAQIITVVHSLIRSTGATTPGEVGIAQLMQLIELARTGGLDDSEHANRNDMSYHRAVRSAR